MEVETPAAIVVRVALAGDGHCVRVTTGKCDAQRHTGVTVDEEIVAFGARYLLYRKSHAAQTRGGCRARHLVFGLTVHQGHPRVKGRGNDPQPSPPHPNDHATGQGAHLSVTGEANAY